MIPLYRCLDNKYCKLTVNCLKDAASQIKENKDDSAIPERESTKEQEIPLNEEKQTRQEKTLSIEVPLVPLVHQEVANEKEEYRVGYDGESAPIPTLRFSEYHRQTKPNRYLRLKEQFKVGSVMLICFIIYIKPSVSTR